jgi:hypothetical protein
MIARRVVCFGTALFALSATIPATSRAANALDRLVPLGRFPQGTITSPAINDVDTYTGGAIIVAHNTAAKGYGLEGAESGSGAGVLGVVATATKVAAFGVYGEGSGPGADGVFGRAATNGFGVIGTSSTGSGVEGEADSASGYGGIFRNTTPLNGVGLYAAGSGGGIEASANNGDGIDGTTTFQSAEGGGASGIFGADDSTDGGSGNAGVLGTSTSGYGVEGIASNNAAIFGTSTNSIGIFAQSGAALSCNAGGGWPFCPAASPALMLQAPDSSPTLPATRGMAIVAQTSTGTPIMSLDAAGNMILAGSLIVDGQLNYGTDGGTCNEPECASPQLKRAGGTAGVERTGEAQLIAGRAYVSLDAGAPPGLDVSKGYHVFVTPEGDCNGLFVTGKTAHGFRVRELHGGRSTLAFDYRVVGKAIVVSSVLPRPETLRNVRFAPQAARSVRRR